MYTGALTGHLRRGYTLGAAGIILVTAVAEPNRDRLDGVTVALAYLLVVLAVATVGGFGPGICTSIAGFLTFNFFFLPPYDSFVVGSPQDVVSLFVFLIVAGVTSDLVGRLQEREREARRRADEAEALSRLGTALLRGATLEMALATVAEQMVRLFALESAAILLPDATGTLRPSVVYPPAARGGDAIDREHAAVAAHVFATGLMAGIGSGHRIYRPHGPEHTGRAIPLRERRVLYLPVRAAGQAMGVIGVTAIRAADYSADERLLLSAFANQAALTIDRARLSEEATHAAAFEQADRLKSALLTTVSHDLRSPLASIKASAACLLEESITRDAATRGEFLVAIDQETDRLTRLVNNLLDLTRIQGGALKPEMEWNDIGDLIASVTELLGPRVSPHPLHAEIAADLPLLRFDFVEIGQVLTNLIENAAKYSDPEREIVVTAERGAAAIRVRVRDHGDGIPEADRPQIFDPFYRVRRDGRARRVSGTGIGLAICRGIIEAHGGTLGVESEEGTGSTFTVTLPMAPAMAENAAFIAGMTP